MKRKPADLAKIGSAIGDECKALDGFYRSAPEEGKQMMDRIMFRMCGMRVGELVQQLSEASEEIKSPSFMKD